MHRPLTLAAAAATALAVSAGAMTGPAVAAPDPTYPTGTFQLATTTQYVTSNGWEPESAFIGLTRLSLSDDVTPLDDIVVRIYSGSDAPHSTQGTVLAPGELETDVRWGGAPDYEDVPAYTLAGTYHPYVTLTDGDGHTTTIDLPTVTLVNDRTAPVVKVKLPKKGHRKAITSWRHISGTVVDAGIDNPATNPYPFNEARLIILQKRKGTWYLYKCDNVDPTKQRTWCKGKHTLAATMAKFRPVGVSTTPVGKTAWRSKYIHGLTKDRLVVATWGFDSNFNASETRIVARYTLNRKK